MATWFEVATSKYEHGGSGWEFGSCIWSPAADRRGAEGRYCIMRAVKEGDWVINCYDFLVRGISKVAGECKNSKQRPPNAGPWSYAQSFYRIELKDFRPIGGGVSIADIARKHRDEIQKDIQANRPKYYLYSWYPVSEFYRQGKIVVSQGRFLAKATPVLVDIFRPLLRLEAELLE